MNNSVYSTNELYKMGPQRTFKSDAREAAFLLGGIGTGNISIGTRGELRDWEIFNKPGKGNKLPYSFFAIRAAQKGRKPISRVLEARMTPPFSNSHGYSSAELAGLPRLEKSTLRGEYPFVWVDFEDSSLPLEISLEAYTPLIPLNPEDSGIPCAILKYRLKNISSEEVDVTIAGSFINPVGYDGLNQWKMPKEDYFVGNVNEFKSEDNISGLHMFSDRYKEDYIRHGSFSLMTTETNVTAKPYWLEGRWWDGPQDFWDDFCDDGLLENSTIDVEKDGNSNFKCGSLGVVCKIAPGMERDITFLLSWYFPNRKKAWDESYTGNEAVAIVKNHYSKFFKNSWDVGSYVIRNMERLEGETRKFHRALFSSTLPDYVLDAVSSNITVLRSTTCFWLENGDFLGWEGCFDMGGCCQGSCTHVWNYAQTLAFLFPSLERSMRNIEFNKETDENGKMSFRTNTVFDEPRWDFHPAADGQLGTIIRLYREWKLSGDNEFLKRLWPNVKKALDFAFTYWDSDGDCVLDSQQHNTYDIEFYGPNSLVNSMFFAALKAGSEMAMLLEDCETAAKYQKAYEEGSKRMDILLWEDEYYVQKIEDVNKHKYQYGTGCLSDQVFGQFLSHVAGLGYVLPEEHIKKTVQSIFRYNFLSSFEEHHSVQRTYTLNDEMGLVLCSWPNGGRPHLPFVYSDEVWTGIEYQVAAHLIYEGFVEEGLTMVKAVRDRHDGYRRNPWNEVECGHHYARSMSSWAVLTALSGYKCDMVNRKIWFSPKINKENFSCFWSTGTAWGIYTQQTNPITGQLESKVDVLYGELKDVEVIISRE